MGVGPSQILADELGAACRRAANGRISSNQLNEPGFVAACEQFISEITSEAVWKTLPDVVTLHLKPLRVVTGHLITKWIEQPGSFFSIASGDQATQLYRNLEAYRDAKARSTVDGSRRRVNLVLFHNLREAFKSRFSKTRRDPLTIYLTEALGATENADDKIKKNCAELSLIGKRYHDLSRLTGGMGGLFVETAISYRRLECREHISDGSPITSEYQRKVNGKAEGWNEAANKLVAHYTTILHSWLNHLKWEPSRSVLGYSTSKTRAGQTARVKRPRLIPATGNGKGEDDTPALPVPQGCLYSGEAISSGAVENNADEMHSTGTQDRERLDMATGTHAGTLGYGWDQPPPIGIAEQDVQFAFGASEAHSASICGTVSWPHDVQFMQNEYPPGITPDRRMGTTDLEDALRFACFDPTYGPT
ncbi:hypothetical protein GE09DRAFT_589704 [Coniochaeta sp. 2T2.1]|nr:hypothetical protein GE09DRAFT_589704 [Coniochaeta sp. 2T2.1]